tara:strand:+ start:143 stop:1753 length:1611 start_codon:yes stop_codon:yes gene_type:complete
MTLLALENFDGLAPKIHPERLASEFAQRAENVRLDRGVIEGWRAPLKTDPLADAVKSIYKYRSSWLTSDFPRQYVDALQPNDVRERIYYTDEDYPKVRSAGQEFKLGLPRPRAPNATVTVKGDTANPTNVFSTRHIVTIVDAWGAEGPSSLAGRTNEVGEDFTIRLDLSGCRVTGPYNLGSGALFRIYRSNVTSSGTGLFQFVAEVPYSARAFDDMVPSRELQEAIPSTDWLAAPDDDKKLYPSGPLKSLVELPGAMLAGHTGNVVFISEPSVPTAWPYYYSNEHEIQAVTVTQSGLFCATNKRPFLLAGSQPNAMVIVPIESEQACVSSRSMVDMGGYGIYASHDGLVVAEGTKADLITASLFDKTAWQKFKPSTIRAFRFETKYVAFYGDIDAGTGFVFDPSGGNGTLTTFSGLSADAFYYDPIIDQYSIAHAPAGRWEIGAFDSGERMTAAWQSKVMVYPDIIALSCIRVRGSEFPITVKIKADGVLQGTFVFPDEEAVRLPGGYRARKWEVEIIGKGPIVGVYLSDSMRELP